MDVQEPEERFEEEPLKDKMGTTEEEQQVPLQHGDDALAVDSARDEEPAQEPEAVGQVPDEAPPESQTVESSASESATEAEAATPPAEAETPPSASGPEAGQPVPGSASTEAPAEAAWYVIHCYSGYENKVRHNLEQRIETMGMKDKIFDVVIPTQEEIEVRDGKRRTVERHIFPGYVLVNMKLSEESWYVVRNTPGVTGFVGMGNLPTPLRPEEVSQIIKRMEAEAPTVKVTFKVGERVRIIDGPFNDFRGTVSEIDMERTKVRVMVSFFGRETPVELDFLQVEKA
jgi:transcriptional antiterminator NusG